MALKKPSLYLENTFLGLCILSGIKETLDKFHYSVLQNGGMRALISAPFLQVFTLDIINAALVQNLHIFCTAAITKNMENGSGIFCQLIGPAFVNALTSQSRTHPLFLVAQGHSCCGRILCAGNFSQRD